MNKKGFTLMELLAVIVILAVLALLVIPITTNLIKTSKKEAFRISVGQVADNITFHYASEWVLEGMSEDKVFDFDTNENINLLTVSGQLPSNGTISINPQGKISINVNNGVYCAVKTIDQDSIQVGEIVNGTCEITGEVVDNCSYAIGYSWDFDYVSTGDDRSQEFSIPCTGNYKLEVWGASGGSYNEKYHGGYGAYARGEIELNDNQKIYLNIGGGGTFGTTKGVEFSGGYNGGGNAYIISSDSYGVASGGGATHIALDRGLLSSFENKQDKLLIVAAGGGGAGYAYFASDNSYYSSGGSGGGYIGGNAKGVTTWHLGAVDCPGATQTQITSITGGQENRTAQPGTFGQGGYLAGGGASNTGGGGGYYGGVGCRNYGGSGGSSYIGNTSLSNKSMYCYDCTASTAENTYTINGNVASNDPYSYTAKIGDGHARITYLGRNTSTVIACSEGNTWEFNYQEVSGSGTEQSFTPPCKGVYKLEVWGAQGGSYNDTYHGGYGGFSTGEIELTTLDTLYLNVGGQGKYRTSKGVEYAGGYNGGGKGYTVSADSNGVGSGGGATHIALESGLLTTFNPSLENSKHDNLLIVAGGGGGGGYVYFASNNSYMAYGGSGGGYIAGAAKGSTTWSSGVTDCPGGTQSLVSSATGGEENRTAQPGTFGQGGYITYQDASYSGGGGGYYGGVGCRNYGSGGGSGYIGNSSLTNKYMYCYNCQTSPSTNENTYTKSDGTNSCNSDASIIDCAKKGNGYARITLIEVK